MSEIKLFINSKEVTSDFKDGIITITADFEDGDVIDVDGEEPLQLYPESQEVIMRHIKEGIPINKSKQK